MAQIDHLEKAERREALLVASYPYAGKMDQRRIWRRYEDKEARPQVKLLDMSKHEEQIRRNRERREAKHGV